MSPGNLIVAKNTSLGGDGRQGTSLPKSHPLTTLPYSTDHAHQAGLKHWTIHQLPL